eukprot:3659030-Pyramimonas_sp.AAC.1
MMISSSSKRPMPRGDVAHLPEELGASYAEHVRLQCEQSRGGNIHLVARVVAVGAPCHKFASVPLLDGWNCGSTARFSANELYHPTAFLSAGARKQVAATDCRRLRDQGPCHRRSSASAGLGDS